MGFLRMTTWRQWVAHPQSLWLRKAIFQLHLWSGIGIGLYVVLLSVTGSVLVFANELYVAATPAPVIVTRAGAPLTDEQIKSAALRAWPGLTVILVSRARNPDQAVSISFRSARGVNSRLFNPYTGADLGNAVPPGIRTISKLIELHDDLLSGPRGRAVNGAGGAMLVVLALTGMVVWWPGIKAWRGSLTLRTNTGWRRFTWNLHSVIGFWSLAFILLFGISGAYFGFPEFFQDLADRIQPPTAATAGVRAVDKVMYWVAFLHFGRINGIGIPCRGPGFCDTATKSVWALFGLAPAAMFVTGALVWWNRVVRPKRRRRD